MSTKMQVEWRRQVFEMSSKGQSQTEIAGTLHISESTISRDLLLVAFTDYLFPVSVSAYSQTDPFPSNPVYKSVVISNRSEQQQIQQPQSKVIESSGHFANNQIENDSVNWIQGGLWHLAVYNSSSSPSSLNSTTEAKAIFSVNDFTSNNVMMAGGEWQAEI